VSLLNQQKSYGQNRWSGLKLNKSIYGRERQITAHGNSCRFCGRRIVYRQHAICRNVEEKDQPAGSGKLSATPHRRPVANHHLPLYAAGLRHSTASTNPHAMEASLDMVSTEDGFEDLGWRARSVGPVLSISVGSRVPHHHRPELCWRRQVARVHAEGGARSGLGLGQTEPQPDTMRCRFGSGTSRA
jgi:hypothetical protein